MSNNIKKGLLIFICLFLAPIIWYAPIWFKGYTPAIPGHAEVIAKNLVMLGRYSSESNKSVILASERVKEEGITSSSGQKMLSLLSAGLYSFFGLPASNRAVFYSVIIHSFALLFFSLIVWGSGFHFYFELQAPTKRVYLESSSFLVVFYLINSIHSKLR